MREFPLEVAQTKNVPGEFQLRRSVSLSLQLGVQVDKLVSVWTTNSTALSTFTDVRAKSTIHELKNNGFRA
jgi:hypothetical protein